MGYRTRKGRGIRSLQRIWKRRKKYSWLLGKQRVETDSDASVNLYVKKARKGQKSLVTTDSTILVKMGTGCSKYESGRGTRNKGWSFQSLSHPWILSIITINTITNIDNTWKQLLEVVHEITWPELSCRVMRSRDGASIIRKTSNLSL